MSIVGHGVDLIEVTRIRAMRERHGEHFLRRIFAPEEFKPFLDQKRCDEHLAARFAAKEAAAKALGTGFVGIAWTDIVVERSGGPPTIRLSGGAEAVAARLGVQRIHLSMSHTEGHAVASVVLST
ncbi:MAG: holo-ACP synthase [Planctomycetota bacterium]